jgi:hypothetical protein
MTDTGTTGQVVQMSELDEGTVALIADLAKEAAEDLPPMEVMMERWIDSASFLTYGERRALLDAQERQALAGTTNAPGNG